MRAVFLAFVVVGYLVAFLPARRCHRDIRGFRHSLWVGYGSREAWLRGVELAYIFFGWPALVVALVWRNGRTRRALVELRDELREVQYEPERIARA
jgi:hypothetical protein